MFYVDEDNTIDGEELMVQKRNFKINNLQR